MILPAALSVFIAGVANAQATNPPATPPGPPTNSGQLITTSINSAQGLINLMCTLSGWMFYFLLALSTIMILWAAYTYMTAGDDTEKTSKARRIITYGAIGIMVALIADAFPNIIGTFFFLTKPITNNGYYC